jgi:DNA invertase Pin-like site-specific DNA recombinase
VELLAYVRLSRETDVTNSPATQRLDIQEWADDHRHNIVGWAEDLDVSGKIPIMERDGAGPWFDHEKISLWQAICGKEVDRLFRDMRDFVNTARDLRDKHRKWIIDVSDGTDTSTTRGMEILEDRAAVTSGLAGGSIPAIEWI